MLIFIFSFWLAFIHVQLNKSHSYLCDPSPFFSPEWGEMNALHILKTYRYINYYGIAKLIHLKIVLVMQHDKKVIKDAKDHIARN